MTKNIFQNKPLNELQKELLRNIRNHKEITIYDDDKHEPTIYFQNLNDAMYNGNIELENKILLCLESYINDYLITYTTPHRWNAKDISIVLTILSHFNMDSHKVYDAINSKIMHNKPENHALFVKCVSEYKECREPEFWLNQLDILGDNYGGLIFNGLFRNGVDVAVKHIEKCCKTDSSANSVSSFIPSIIIDFNFDSVKNELETKIESLPKEINEIYESTIRLFYEKRNDYAMLKRLSTASIICRLKME